MCEAFARQPDDEDDGDAVGVVDDDDDDDDGDEDDAITDVRADGMGAKLSFSEWFWAQRVFSVQLSQHPGCDP